MNKGSPVHLSISVRFIFILCACSLALHFVAEGLAPVAGVPGFDLVEQGGHAHLVHEHGEDRFIFPILTRLPAAHTDAHLTSPVVTGAFFLSLSPLMPPPNS